MERRSLIIYCDNTPPSKELNGPSIDNSNYRTFLTSNLGGKWVDEEIKSMNNPSIKEVQDAVASHFNGAGYTFTIFTGHGGINPRQNDLQYLQLKDGNLSILELKNSAERQTIVIDACRTHLTVESVKSFALTESIYKMGAKSTREMFDKEIERCEKGLTILYAASKEEAARDSKSGGAYLVSLISAALLWEKRNKEALTLPLYEAHDLAKDFLSKHFPTEQHPQIEPDKRNNYFPFAVKYMTINL